MYEKIQETASWLKERMTTSPKTAIILGTGLGQLASEITDSYEFPYSEIPNFPVSTVQGHAGKLIFGKLGGKDIMAMEGRFHYYEGYDMKAVTGMIKSFQAMGEGGGADSAALSVGISEALINTAFGILTSWCAVVSYNTFTNKVDKLTYALDEVGYSIAQTYEANHAEEA